jgi:hypothetical protein
VIRRILLIVVVGAAMVAAAIWLPREEDVAADSAIAEMPLEVGFLAEGIAPAPPFVEGWTLSFPDVPPALQVLTLQIGAIEGTTAAGRLTAMPGEPRTLLERIALVLSSSPEPTALPAAPVPPTEALDLRLDLLGDRLSVGRGEVGATVIAGAFVAAPAGEWRVYRLTIGAGGPQCFLGLSGAHRTAVLLPRAVADGPAILARFRSLLVRTPAGS